MSGDLAGQGTGPGTSDQGVHELHVKCEPTCIDEQQVGHFPLTLRVCLTNTVQIHAVKPTKNG